MTTTTLWDFAKALWDVIPVRRAVFRFQAEFQQSACLLIALCWLAAIGRACTPGQSAALRELADVWERRLAPLRRLVQETAAASGQTDWHRALLRAQLEGEKSLLHQLQTTMEEWPTSASAAQSATLDALVLQTLPEIGFCEGQTQLLAELVLAWQRHQGLSGD